LRALLLDGVDDEKRGVQESIRAVHETYPTQRKKEKGKEEGGELESKGGREGRRGRAEQNGLLLLSPRSLDSSGNGGHVQLSSFLANRDEMVPVMHLVARKERRQGRRREDEVSFLL